MISSQAVFENAARVGMTVWADLDDKPTRRFALRHAAYALMSIAAMAGTVTTFL